MKTKKCTKCGVEKEATLEYFRKDKCKSGLKAACTECKKKQEKEYRKNNKEKCSLAVKLWKKANPDRMKVIRKRSYNKNKEKRKKYREGRKEEQKVLHREWAKRQTKKYRRDCHLKWKNNNPQRYKAIRKKADDKRSLNLPDSEIKKRIKNQTGLSTEDITPEMIETKRLLTFIKRELKKKSK